MSLNAIKRTFSGYIINVYNFPHVQIIDCMAQLCIIQPWVVRWVNALIAIDQLSQLSWTQHSASWGRSALLVVESGWTKNPSGNDTEPVEKYQKSFWRGPAGIDTLTAGNVSSFKDSYNPNFHAFQLSSRVVLTLLFGEKTWPCCMINKKHLNWFFIESLVIAVSVRRIACLVQVTETKWLFLHESEICGLNLINVESPWKLGEIEMLLIAKLTHREPNPSCNPRII